jgi:hypothetical protein
VWTFAVDGGSPREAAAEYILVVRRIVCRVSGCIERREEGSGRWLTTRRDVTETASTKEVRRLSAEGRGVSTTVSERAGRSSKRERRRRRRREREGGKR